MKVRILTLGAALMAAQSTLQAQIISTTQVTATAQATERRLQLEAQAEAAASARAARTPEQREAGQARRSGRAAVVTAAEVQFRSDLRAYQNGLRDKAADLQGQVKAGVMTSAEMAAELKAYREANRPRQGSASAISNTSTSAGRSGVTSQGSVQMSGSASASKARPAAAPTPTDDKPASTPAAEKPASAPASKPTKQ